MATEMRMSRRTSKKKEANVYDCFADFNPNCD